MSKKTCALVGMHVLLVAGVSLGYICMYKKMKKTKQNCLDM